MEILHLHETLALRGGAEVYLLDLLSRQRERGHEVKLLETLKVSPGEILRAAREAEIIHLHVIYYRTPFRLLFDLLVFHRAVLTVHDLLNFCPRLLLTPPDGGLCLSPAGLHCVERCFGRPTLPLLRDLLRHLLKRALLRRARVILCPSRFVLTVLKHFGFPKERLRHLPLYLPPLPGDTRPGAPPFPGRGLRILFVGRASEGKGFFVLKEALERLASPFTALAVGPGRAELTFRNGRLVLLPPLPRGALRSLYEAADVCVVPSLAPESFCFVGLEALSCGCPVLASFPGGQEEWLREGENGFLFPRGDAAALARLLDELSSERALLERLKRNAPETAAPFLDPEPHLEGLENLYPEI